MNERVDYPAGTNQEEPQKGQEQGGEGDVGALGGCGGFLSPRRRAAADSCWHEVGACFS